VVVHLDGDRNASYGGAVVKAKAGRKSRCSIDETLKATEKLLDQPLSAELAELAKALYYGPREGLVNGLVSAALRVARGAVEDGAMMAVKMATPHTLQKPEVEYTDLDGLTIAAQRLEALSPKAFNDVLELAYAYLLVLGAEPRELARLGLVTVGSGARAAAMLIATAEGAESMGVQL